MILATLIIFQYLISIFFLVVAIYLVFAFQKLADDEIPTAPSSGQKRQYDDVADDSCEGTPGKKANSERTVKRYFPCVKPDKNKLAVNFILS